MVASPVRIANHCRLGSPIRMHLLKLIPTVKMNSNQLEPPTSLFSNGGSNLKTVHPKKIDDDPPLPTAFDAQQSFVVCHSGTRIQGIIQAYSSHLFIYNIV